MDDDWDLHAVVRGCTSTTTTTAAAAAEQTPCTQYFSTSDQDCSSSFQDLLFEPRRENFSEELHDLCKPFFNKSQEIIINSEKVVFSPQRLILPVSPLSVLGGLQQDLSFEQHVVKQPPPKIQIQQKTQLFSVVNGSKAGSSHHPSPKSKKRKNPLKKVCHVSAEGLSSDMWSWRKYGQKPIKGSPYPRGYYKCSTLAGCMARKQVERNRSDPGMFIITYTAEHNHPMPTHRNSLAGISRHKPSETASNSNEPAKKPSSSSPEMSPLEKSAGATDDQEDDEEDFSPSNMELDDSFFAGLDDFAGNEGGDCFPDHFPASLQFPWLSKNVATTGGAAAAAAGGGG